MHVLFVCPHGAAKSVIATAMLRLIAEQRRINVTASNAGTDPDDEISPIALSALRERGLEFTEAPRLVTRKDIEQADIVVTLGCALGQLPIMPGRFVDWSDTPNASDDVNALCEILSGRLPLLLD